MSCAERLFALSHGFRVFFAIASSAWCLPVAGAAQSARIQVREETTQKPLAGAMVSLAGAADTAIMARLTDDAGFAGFRAPAPGQYHLTVRRIGYRPSTTVLSVSDTNVTDVIISLTDQRVVLSTVVVETRSSCRNTKTEGDRVFQLWENIRNALEINRLTESQGLVRMEIEKYDRDLDQRLIERSKHLQRKEAATNQPFAAASPSYLERGGYVRSIDGNVTYFAPDAQTLLSDEFARSHCFSVKPGRGDERNFVGLAFAPLPEHSQPDVTGVLWLDAKTLALHHLAFQYVSVPSPIPVTGLGGRLEFQQLPSGAWIIPRWYIRTPRLARVIHNVGTLSRPEMADTLLGFRETGATALVLGEGEQAVAATNSHVASFEQPATKSAAAHPTSRETLCAGSGSSLKGNTLYGRVSDASGATVPQARLSVSWNAVRLKVVGTAVIAGQNGESIDVEPDSHGNYALCGLPTGVEYRLELRRGVKSLEIRRVAAPDVPERIEINFTVRPALPPK